MREVKQSKQGAVGAAVPELKLCSQHSLRAVLSHPDEKIIASLKQPYQVFDFSILSILNMAKTQ